MKFTVLIRSKYLINSCKQLGIVNKSDKVLDVGCGNGIMGSEFKKAFKCDVTGTDIMYYMDKDSIIDYVGMTRPDVLPFTSKLFDLVIINEVLHHTDIDTQLALINEAKRVGHRLLIFEEDPSFMAKFIDIVINNIHNKAMSRPLNFQTKERWLQILSVYFNNVKCFDIPTSFYYPLEHIGFLCTNY